MKERLLQAAVQQISEYGPRFTVDDIVRRVGISKKTFYRYYASKEALVSCIVDAALEDVRRQEEVVLAQGLNLVDTMKALMVIEPQLLGPMHEVVKADIEKLYPQEWKKIERYQQHSARQLAAVLDRGIQQGQFRKVHVPMVTQILINMCSEFLKYRFLAEHKLMFQDALRELTDIVLYGVLAPTGAITRDPDTLSGEN